MPNRFFFFALATKCKSKRFAKIFYYKNNQKVNRMKLENHLSFLNFFIKLRKPYAIFFIFVISCSINYEGDGNFFDYKKNNYDNYYSRFHVDFGEIKMKKGEIYIFKMESIPKARTWIFGFMVKGNEFSKEELANIRIKIAIDNQHFHKERIENLHNWEWMKLSTKMSIFVHGTQITSTVNGDLLIRLEIIDSEINPEIKLPFYALGSNYPW